jgi:hypothetical protein
VKEIDMSVQEDERAAYAKSAQRDAQAVAGKLRALADRIDQLATAFPATDRPVSLAADIVNDYTQGVGGVGTHLWSLVKDAEDLAQAIKG